MFETVRFLKNLEKAWVLVCIWIRKSLLKSPCVKIQKVVDLVWLLTWMRSSKTGWKPDPIFWLFLRKPELAENRRESGSVLYVAALTYFNLGRGECVRAFIWKKWVQHCLQVLFCFGVNFTGRFQRHIWTIMVSCINSDIQCYFKDLSSFVLRNLSIFQF